MQNCKDYQLSLLSIIIILLHSWYHYMHENLQLLFTQMVSCKAPLSSALTTEVARLRKVFYYLRLTCFSILRPSRAFCYTEEKMTLRYISKLTSLCIFGQTLDKFSCYEKICRVPLAFSPQNLAQKIRHSAPFTATG